MLGPSTPGTHGAAPADPTNPSLPLPGSLCCYSGCGPNCGNYDCGGSGAGLPLPDALTPPLDYPCADQPRIARALLGSSDMGHALGGCVCEAGAYIGQRDCTETNDLHQDASGFEVMGGDYIVAEIGPGDQYYIDRTYRTLQSERRNILEFSIENAEIMENFP